MSKLLKIVVRIIIVLAFGVIALGLLIARPAWVASVEDQTDTYVSADKLKEHVVYLSETSLPRDSANPQNLDKVAAYINAELSAYSADVAFQTYLVNGQEYKNVVASFGPETEEVTIVGAHYDAYAELPGAYDNASGIAGLIELGKLLSTTDLKQQVLLVAYTLEEPPYFASADMGSYVHAASITNRKVKLMISLEMIGYFSDREKSQRYPISLMGLSYPSRGNYIAVVDTIGSNNAVGVKSAINKYTDLPAYSINAPRGLVGIDFSDHRSYWDFDFPAVMVTDTAFYRNRAYHTEQDTYDRLNYKLMAKVVFGVYKYIQDADSGL